MTNCSMRTMSQGYLSSQTLHLYPPRPYFVIKETNVYQRCVCISETCALALMSWPLIPADYCKGFANADLDDSSRFGGVLLNVGCQHGLIR